MIKRSFITCKTALSPSKLPGLDYSLNPYRGCEHGCVYCYSRSFLDRELAFKWGTFVNAKQNILEILSKEVKLKPKGVVGVSTVSDPYQPLEKELELTRGALKILSDADFPVSIQTKSNLILRDMDLIRPEKFDVGVTITTTDPDLARKIEPRASPPDARAQVLEEFSSRGVETWLFLGPIIPGITDSEKNLEEVITAASRSGSRVIYDKLNLRRWVWDSLRLFLDENYPPLLDKIPGWCKDMKRWTRTSALIDSICKKLSVPCEPAFS
jgi:DNA repair photolyase